MSRRPPTFAPRFVVASTKRLPGRTRALGSISFCCSSPGGRMVPISVRSGATRGPVLPTRDDVLPRAAIKAVAMPRRRVLLVEDNDINALLARRMLEKSGFEIEHAVNGLEALQVIERMLDKSVPRFDLVLMDVHMPVMDGIEAAQRVKCMVSARGLNAHAMPPIVALTANAFPEDRKRCLDGGMDDYLSKPFEKSELDALIAKWCRDDTPGVDAA